MDFVKYVQSSDIENRFGNLELAKYFAKSRFGNHRCAIQDPMIHKQMLAYQDDEYQNQQLHIQCSKMGDRVTVPTQ